MIPAGGMALCSAIALAMATGSACAGAGNPPPTDPSPAGSTSPARPSSDTPKLLDSALIATLPAPERAAWVSYIARSAMKHAAERAAMAAELRTVGRDRMTRAPYQRQAFEVTDRMTEAWFRSDSGRALAASILSFQTPSGGWSKHVDFSQGPRQPGQSWFSESDGWSYIGTIDNGSTTNQLLFLAAAQAASPDERYSAAFLKGLDYLLDAQFPNGCLPQVYPLQGSYHDAVTFNDDAVVNVLKVFRDVGRDRYDFVPAEARERVAAGLARGVECLVRSQVVVAGRRTAWGQQHHPITLAPIAARSYELVGLSGRESAGIAEFLMSLSRPGPDVVEAVHAAVDWLRKTQIHGYSYSFTNGLIERPGAGPIWARLYEIGTDRPIFSNRDGVKLYDWNQLTDRRQGYGWFGDEGVGVLKKYDTTWAGRYPRQAGSGASRNRPAVQTGDRDHGAARSES